VADLLREAGYVTGMIGKSHLGSQPQFHPMERGFDEFFGFLHGANIYMDPPSGPGFHHVDTEVEARRESRDELHPILRGKEIVEEPEYLTDAFSREAVDFITRHKDEEFFLYLPYNAPHTPLQVTEKYYARFPHIEDERERIFAAMVSAVDDGIGWIFETLKKEGLWEDTMVIFFSDNGCATYTEACFNDPLLGGKLSLFEGGQRVPFMLQYPRELKGGQEYDRPVSSLDVLPTALMLGGGTIPENIDGIDLLPFLKGDITGDPHEALCWRVGDNSAVRQGDWKLVNLDKGKHILLYDLSTDIGELNDLASENPEKTEALSKLLADWEAELVEPLWPSRRIIPYEIEGLKFNLFV
jgi:arylsulfatase A-like enzyme